MVYYPMLLLKGKFEIVDIGGEVTAVSIEENKDSFHGIIKLGNDSAKFMFQKLQAGITVPELIKACMDEYQTPNVEDVGPKVLDFINQLTAQGLVLVDKSRGIKFEETAKGENNA